MIAVKKVKAMAAYYDSQHKTWYVKFRYTDWMGNSKSTSKRGFKKKSDALRYEADFKNTSKEKPNISMAKLIDEYLSDSKKRVKENTYLTRKQTIDRFILKYFRKLNISDVTPIIVRKWQTEILEMDISESYKKLISDTLRGLMNFAVKYYNLPYNPVSRAGNIGSYERRNIFIEQSEWEKMDAFITDIYDKTALNILYYGGLRIGELLGLTVRDIDFEKNTISINKQIQHGKLSTLKTKTSRRIITMPEKIMDLLYRLLEAFYDGPPRFIFGTDKTRWNKALNKYRELINRPDITLHSLRHSHASLLIKHGIPINAVSQRLGHASPSITLNVYAHVYSNSDREIANILDDISHKSVGQL